MFTKFNEVTRDLNDIIVSLHYCMDKDDNTFYKAEYKELDVFLDFFFFYCN